MIIGRLSGSEDLRTRWVPEALLRYYRIKNCRQCSRVVILIIAKHILFYWLLVRSKKMSPDPAPTLSTPVLVVGAGPTGLIAALNLAQHGIECVLVDRNESVGEWPKMDLTNSRSMELLRRMGLADEIRVRGMFLRCFLLMFSVFGRTVSRLG